MWTALNSLIELLQFSRFLWHRCSKRFKIRVTMSNNNQCHHRSCPEGLLSSPQTHACVQECSSFLSGMSSFGSVHRLTLQCSQTRLWLWVRKPNLEFLWRKIRECRCPGTWTWWDCRPAKCRPLKCEMKRNSFCGFKSRPLNSPNASSDVRRGQFCNLAEGAILLSAI